MTLTIDINLTLKQQEFLDASYKYSIIFFGGAKGGGKSRGLRDVLLLRALETPMLRIGLFRKTFPELRANHIDKYLEERPWLKEFYAKTEHIFRLPNGSTIELCHLANDDDVFLYQGREYDILAVDEAGQWKENILRTLQGSNRTTKIGVKPVMLLTGNPGGIGHAFLKRLFVDRKYNVGEDPTDYYFIPAKVYDNPVLMERDPEYVKRLESEPNEILRRAYLDGDWNVFAGQFFTEWRREVHVCEPFEVPGHWIRFGAYDPGHFHPASFGWFACDELGRVYLYREYIERGLRTDQVADYVSKFEDTKLITNVWAGRDCWARGRDGGPTIAEQFRTLPVHTRLTNLLPAKTDRIQGASQVRAFIAHENMPKGIEGPRLIVFSNCVKTIECIPRLIHDPKRPEDVLKVDATESNPFGGDDAYDMLRYGLMSRPRVSQVPEHMIEFKITSYDDRVKAFTKKRKKTARQRSQGKNNDAILGKQY